MPVTADAAYPPEPWHLRAELHVSLWHVPARDLPAAFTAAVPPDARLVTVAGRALVGTAFVRYLPGGVLTYHELLAATLVLDQGRLRVTIGAIWVDSPPAAAGGRDLWGIPKDRARFARCPADDGRVRWRAERDGATLAEAVVAPGPRWPGAWRPPLATVQRLAGTTTVASVRTTTRARRARAAWRVPTGTPLGFLTGRRPVTTVVLDGATLQFGSARGSDRR